MGNFLERRSTGLNAGYGFGRGLWVSTWVMFFARAAGMGIWAWFMGIGVGYGVCYGFGVGYGFGRGLWVTSNIHVGRFTYRRYNTSGLDSKGGHVFFNIILKPRPSCSP